MGAAATIFFVRLLIAGATNQPAAPVAQGAQGEDLDQADAVQAAQRPARVESQHLDVLSRLTSTSSRDPLEMNARCDRTTATLISSWQTTSRSTDDDDATPPSPAFHPAVEAFKRRLLADTIGSCGGNKAEAARRLGLQRTYLYRLVRQLGLERSSTENPSQA